MSTSNEVLSNRFIYIMRIEARIDEQEYAKLCDSLRRLAAEVRGQRSLRRDVAQVLYVTPQFIHSTLLRARAPGSPFSNLTDRLEEMWIEVDAIVLDCLAT